MTTTKITAKWQTICTVAANPWVIVERIEGDARKAKGGVCHCQARRSGKNGLRGRLVNANGSHQEIGYAFPIDADKLRHWESIAEGQR
jgi:hypothetical protein